MMTKYPEQEEGGCKNYLCAEQRWGLRCLLLWSALGVATFVGFEGMVLGKHMMDQLEHHDAPTSTTAGDEPSNTLPDTKVPGPLRRKVPAKAEGTPPKTPAKITPKVTKSKVTAKAAKVTPELEQVPMHGSKKHKGGVSARKKARPQPLRSKADTPKRVRLDTWPGSAKVVPESDTGSKNEETSQRKHSKNHGVAAKGTTTPAVPPQPLSKTSHTAKPPEAPPPGAAKVVPESDNNRSGNNEESSQMKHSMKHGAAAKQTNTHGGAKAQMKKLHKEKVALLPDKEVSALEEEAETPEVESTPLEAPPKKDELKATHGKANKVTSKQEAAIKAQSDFDAYTVLPEQKEEEEDSSDAYEASGAVDEILKEHPEVHKLMFQNPEFANAKNSLQQGKADNFLLKDDTKGR